MCISLWFTTDMAQVEGCASEFLFFEGRMKNPVVLKGICTQNTVADNVTVNFEVLCNQFLNYIDIHILIIILCKKLCASNALSLILGQAVVPPR